MFIMIELIHTDCMAYMATLPDKAFDLAICDPPYGIGFDCEKPTMVTNNSSGKWNGARGRGYKNKDWDKNTPDAAYFNELNRISKRQIIWGGNYFSEYLKPSGGWIVWDKIRPEEFSLSQAELAWVSDSGRVSIFKYLWHGFQKQEQESRFHPTQKPVQLYKWLLKNYAKDGDRILDTHLGSGSSAIAAYDGGFDFVGCEIDKDYFDAAKKRFEIHQSQGRLF
jgi:site-specific DNA-methyltransferase (adenine-specific)